MRDAFSYGNLRYPYGGFGNLGSGVGFIPPTAYPATSLATEVWEWGNATGTYTSVVQADSYVEGGTSPSVSYGVAGPPGTSMDAVSWGNDTTNDSHHTSPGTTAGQSNGPVNANMIPGASSFKFYFFLKHKAGTTESFYTFFDYDLQEDGATFNQGIQIFVSTVGLFAPCSLVAIMKDSNNDFPQFHAKTGGLTLFEDNTWHFLELIFDRSVALPTFKLNGKHLSVSNTFGGPAVNAMGSITPTNGIRFAQKEFAENTTGASNITMAGAAYSKDLSYTWE